MADETQKDIFGSSESIIETLTLVEINLRLLEEAYCIPIDQKDERWQVIKPLIYSVIDSLKTVTLLTRYRRLRDLYVISRVIVETSINACFVFAKGEEAVKKAKQHAVQKTYSDLDREVTIGGNKLHLNHNGKIPSDFLDEAKDAIDNYTSKKGREITSWTPESIIERIEIVQSKYGEGSSIDLIFAFFSIYRHASEIAHGTYFGALFSIGLTQPNQISSEKDLENFMNRNFQMLLMMLYATTDGLINVLAIEYPELEHIKEQSGDGIKKMRITLSNENDG